MNALKIKSSRIKKEKSNNKEIQTDKKPSVIIEFNTPTEQFNFVEVHWKDAVNGLKACTSEINKLDLAEYRSFGHLLVDDEEKVVILYGINKCDEIDYMVIPKSSVISIKKL
ncbi:MAG: hypothetical protein QW727_04595 [Candidatus Pacearchaeota archaeon]